MNMIMDNNAHQHHQQTAPPAASPQRGDLRISTTPPTQQLSQPLSHNRSNTNGMQISPTTVVPTGKVTLKRSFDVAFLMMPDERIKQKQIEKEARLSEAIERHQRHHQQHHQNQHQYPTDLSPRTQQQQAQQAHLQHLHEQAELFNLQEARRYPQITIRSPRIYDDPTVVIPPASSNDSEPQPMKSAFTKVSSSRNLESPVTEPAPPLSPDQLSCPSMSPPMATTPPRTNSGNGSLSNGSSSSAPPCLNPNIVYQNFRPEYQFNGAFQSVNQVQALQAHRIKQHLMYRPQMTSSNGSTGNHNGGNGAHPPPEFLHSYPGFPFPHAAHHFAAVAPPELPRMVQNPAAAAILSTLIPPTLASTFTLTAQNVCAKCNISFRMTSDLVYHMRSHHKSEVACDPNRRKREDKLKCPVCQESFRERHHLTRHMTAHQDKESDQAPHAGGSGSGSSSNNEIINVGSISNNRHHASRVSGASK